MAGVINSKPPRNILLTLAVILLVLFQFRDCSEIPQNSDNYEEKYSEPDSNYISCESIYQYYLHMIDNFTNCELKHARPFTMCINCTEQFEVAKAIYKNLTEEPRYVDCKIKYMQSDRVQVIPTVQANMEDIWSTAHCQNCYSYTPDGLESGRINYSEDVTWFLELYKNFSNCINTAKQEYVHDLWTQDENASSKCDVCRKNYSLLNEYYNQMYDDYSGDVCMDLMDRMNSTRMFWSLELNCTHHNGDHDKLPVIIISCVVACTPIIFYVSLRVTGKVDHKKIFEQKRLRKRVGTSMDSQGTSDNFQGAGGDIGTSRRRLTTAD